MTSSPGPAAATWSIATVERETGISKDTLRVWERRYGFPNPERDTLGDRRFSSDQVERLQAIKRLMDGGHRAGKVVPLPAERLAELEARQAKRGGADRTGPAGGAAQAPAAHAVPIEVCLALVTRHDTDALRSTLRRSLAQHGVLPFITELAAPLTQAIGDAWARGDVQVFEEHLFTECLDGVLQEATADLRRLLGRSGPNVLLATGPGEHHTLALRMVEALLTLEGADCLSLGTHAPLQQIVKAAAARQAQIVCLSCSAAANRHHVVASVSELRTELPGEVQLWVGGAGAAVLRQAPPGVDVFDSLRSVPRALNEWRQRRAP